MIQRTIKKFLSDSDDLRTERTIIAFIVSFIIALIISLNNGLELVQALSGSLYFSLLVTAIVAVLAWAVDIARQKGYPGWLGFLAVLFLQIFGILLLLFLPPRKA